MMLTNGVDSVLGLKAVVIMCCLLDFLISEMEKEIRKSGFEN